MSRDPGRVLVVDDDDAYRQIIVDHLRRKGVRVWDSVSAEDALTCFERQDFDVALIDLIMSGMDGLELLRELRQRDGQLQAIVLTGHGSIATAIKAMKLGAYNYLTKPCKLAELEAVVEKACEQARLLREHALLKDALRYSYPDQELLGESAQMKQVRQLIAKVAESTSNVLIQGESGTGKELAARAIHLTSPRASEPFVVVHCAALPESLLESELFGYEQGAFTGATHSKRGLFELADKGTLFIDEIAEMSGGVQAKLLRALETGEFRHLGGTRQSRASVRVVAATNKELLEQVKEGSFRDDLYYRITVVTINMPPLRQHPEDIPMLVKHFLKLRRSPSGTVKGISPQALELLSRYHWPGNVRELGNVVERVALLSQGDTIEPSDLAAPLGQAMPEREPLGLREVEKAHVLKILKATGGNKAQAARILGVHRTELYRLIEKHKLQ